MRAYKVVVLDRNGKWRSAWVHIETDKVTKRYYDLVYELGKVTYPRVPGTPIMAFSSMFKAIDWGKMFALYAKYAVFEVEAEKADVQCFEIPVIKKSYWGGLKNIRNWWLNGEGRDRGFSFQDILDTTVFCKWVKPIALLETNVK